VRNPATYHHHNTFMENNLSAIEPTELRKTLGSFLTGVTIVTTIDANGQPRGFTANSFTSVSLDPPLVLVCLGKSASSYPVFSKTPQFAINILGEHQKGISSTFSSKKVADKFAEVAVTKRKRSSPVLDGVLAWLDCDIEQLVDAGDHVVMIGRVIEHEHSEGAPLGFHSGNYVDFSLSRQVAEPAAHQAKVCGIFEYEDQLLFVREGDKWGLPSGRTLGEETAEKHSLFGILNELGLKAAVTFIFSVTHEEATGGTGVYYRGNLTAAPVQTENLRLFPLSDLPLDAMPAYPDYRSLLRRFIRERTESRYGVYAGTTQAGKVRVLASE
jgi:flavin reductase (DIM6/NTAB) family NADH-FMN oxidoreductase RutF